MFFICDPASHLTSSSGAPNGGPGSSSGGRSRAHSVISDAGYSGTCWSPGSAN